MWIEVGGVDMVIMSLPFLRDGVGCLMFLVGFKLAGFACG